MKKIVALAVFLAAATTFSFAQSSDLRFGFQLSPTFSWLNATSNQISSSGTNLGIKLGLEGEIQFEENYALTTGIGFAFNQGGTLQYERTGVYWPNSDKGINLDTLPAGVKLKYQIQYLEIPIGLKMRTRQFGYVSYFLEPALTFGIETQSTGSIKGMNVGNDAEEIDIRQEVNSIYAAWGLTGGIEYSISENTALVGGIGFQLGFSDVTDDSGREIRQNGESTREDSKGKGNSITILLAVMF